MWISIMGSKPDIEDMGVFLPRQWYNDYRLLFYQLVI